MTKLVKEIFSLAQKATRAEQYAAINAILALLEEEDASLSSKQLAELDRRDALLKAGKMPVLPAEDVLDTIQSKLDKAS